MNRNTTTVAKLLGVVVFMGGLAWASVPLYDWFCRVTGFGGTTAVAEAGSDEILDRTITLIPDLDLNERGSIAVWLTHTAFAMPFSIFLLHNYITELPKEIFESARLDGADHFTIFYRIVLPLSIPALAAFAIFQFLWTWNDFLIAVTMLSGGDPIDLPTTVRIANLAGDFGRNEHLLPAGAFVQAAVPLIVFFSLQRYFVRGLLAGSVKG